jgi:Xaa-Pro aminopeptidase
MKSDLDRLMAERDLQAIVVTGGEHPNMPRQYLCNGKDIHGGLVIKKRGSEAVLIVGGMEIEEAGKTGLEVHTFAELGQAELFKDVKTDDDMNKASIAMWGRYIDFFQIPPGKIGLYGTGDLNVYIELVKRLAEAYPDHPFVGEMGMSLFTEAYVTKDANEIRLIREVADATNAVLQETWDFIAGHKAENGTVVKEDGTQLTIGDVKRFVRRALLDHELEDEGSGMIFAQGRDAGFPHSRGEADMALKLGQPIVFDLFPRKLGGGYFHDVTRTWSIGYATPEVQAIYDQVSEAFQIALDAYDEPGQPTHIMQEAVLDFYERNGHPTARSQPGTQEGYVHSLGHGAGLNIHERPSLSHLAKKDTFQKGNFVTIEPGLYYPERGIGMRLEDSFIIDDNGELVSISPFKKDLVLPLKG